MTAGYETLSQLTPEHYEEFKRKGDLLEKGITAAAEKYDIPVYLQPCRFDDWVLLHK